ncbi:MAG: PIN domain-containing protein [Rhodopseudomonas sp.]|nr:PIN domain-containing protein [Rhodopseudomonas sp.]
MNSIIDASNMNLDKTRILFDTNTWIFIYGFGGNSAAEKARAYSDAYSKLLKSTNRIVVNDYVLGEFCNKCARYEYEIRRDSDPKFPAFKKYRSSSDFSDVMESIRDTCFHILDDSDYIRVGVQSCNVHEAVDGFCKGTMDFSDLILVEYCQLENLFLMTDDADFKGCGINIITHNRKLLKG